MIVKNFLEVSDEIQRNLQIMTRKGASLGGFHYSHQTDTVAYHCRSIRKSLLYEASMFFTQFDSILIIVNIPRILSAVYEEIETEAI